jgi:basic membrane lipoprotein Med (substrate-binding protein (PBP1-ABC) superfamily)
MKRVSIVLTGLGLVVALGVSACGDSSPSASEGGSDDVSIGVIQEARPDEQPWSAAMHDALEKLKKEDGNVSVTESYDAYDPTRAEPIARQYLTGGTDVLVMHSFALEEVSKSIAPQFPEVPMASVSFAGPVKPNLSFQTTSYLQIGYANCWLLGKLSTSGTIGIVGPQPIPYSEELERGCELGAKAAGVEMLAAYSNSFTDQQATREQAQVLVDKGADGLFPSSATEDSLGGFKLCEDLDMNCAGWTSDARRYAPTTAVTSVIVDWSGILKLLVDDARNDRVRSETWNATFENKGLVPQPFEGATGDRVPADVQKEFEGIVSNLAEGTIELPASIAHPCCP